ncbi:MAG: Gfo/Idh/MocA family oxidoreductase [Anaerolineae bacterium]|nr:Gfo/Idh/MocA family oxidoreductase [Anaerolineae bacterium]
MQQPVRVCLVGAGRAGRVHAGSLVKHLPGGELAAVVDLDTTTRVNLQTDFGIEEGFDSLSEAIDKTDFQAVVITTPTFSHHDLTLEAAAAGRHVLLEKPMALTLEECDAMSAAAQANGVHLQLGFMRRFDPDFAAAEERIRAGEIGEPMLIKSLTHGPGLPPEWARDQARSNGMLAEVNSHDWDCTRWLMGSNPTRVYAETANFKGEARGVQAEDFYDTALVNLRFENGGLGSISGVCPCDYGYDARVEIVGEKGIMQIGELKGESILVSTNRDTGLQTPIFKSWPKRFAQAYINEMAHFIECIQTDTPPKVGAGDGRWAVAGVLAATRSLQEGRPVELNEVLA